MNVNTYKVVVEKIPPPIHSGKKTCAFTMDVEDWYQSSVDFDAPITEQVIRNVEIALDLLDNYGIKGTFFIQGRVAETFPQIIRRLAAEGHEIQSHGYSHRPLTEMDRPALRNELERARKTVEDSCGMQVTAFRAPDFTIFRQNLWALEVLVETGFTLDSSIFPMRTHRYGISNWEAGPHRIHFPNGSSILEVPVAVLQKKHWRLPVAGGGYLRLLPFLLQQYAFEAIMADQRPVIIYCHPYEFNPDEMNEYRGKVPLLTQFLQGFGRKAFAKRIRNLSRRFSFGRFDQTLLDWDVI